MLTTDITTMQPGQPLGQWVIEADLEYGHLQVHGRAAVCRSLDGSGMQYIESRETGGCYDERQVLPGTTTEIWTAEDHILAVFPTEDAMRQGAGQIVDCYGDRLPAGIYRALTSRP